MWIFLCNDIIIIGDSMIKVSRTNYYGHDPEGFVILIILNVLSFFILNYCYEISGFEVTDLFSFLTFVIYGGLPVISCLFFMLCGVGVLYTTLTNMKKYDDIVLFSDVVNKKKRSGNYIFYDAEGKKYSCFIIGNHNFVHKKYYKVRRTKYEILYILGGTNKKFSLPEKEKKLFWATWYLPGGVCVENLFLLPIIYVIALAGISLLLNGDIQFIVFLPVYILMGIDFGYKFKKR